ncbi:hypothetical protein LPJ59_005912, partial [Coemansia sp. RSA 2399]
MLRSTRLLSRSGSRQLSCCLEIQQPPTPTADVAQEPIAGPGNFMLPMVVIFTLAFAIVMAKSVAAAVAAAPATPPAALPSAAPVATPETSAPVTSADNEGWTLVGRGGKAVRSWQGRRRAGRPSAGAVAARARAPVAAPVTAPAAAPATAAPAVAAAPAAAPAIPALVPATYAAICVAPGPNTRGDPQRESQSGFNSQDLRALSVAPYAEGDISSMDEEECGGCMRSLLNVLASDNFEVVSDMLLEWANLSARETDGWVVCGLIRGICAKAAEEPRLAHLHAQLCRRLVCGITSGVVENTLANGMPTRLEGILVHGLLLETCQNMFEGIFCAMMPVDA